MGAQGDIIKHLLRKFPNAPSKTIARMALAEDPQVFATSDVDSIRSTVRYYRGAAGKKHAKELADDEFVREKGEPGDAFQKLPDPLDSFEDSSPVEIGEEKALLLNDIHIPYHEKAVVEEAWRHGQKEEVDAVVLGGDALDFYSISKWEKDPRQRNFPLEVKMGRAFFEALREAFPTQALYFKMGNHEERWERYLYAKAPEVVGIEDFELKNIFYFDKLGIRFVDKMQHYMMGNVAIIHGHEMGGSYVPLSAARTIYTRLQANAICGHWHSTSRWSAKNMHDEYTVTYSTGALCNLHPRYSRYNRWNHGFAILTKNGVGTRVDNYYMTNDGPVAE